MVFLRALVKSPLRTTKLSILPMPSSTTRPAGLYAIEIFYRSFPAIPDHTFEDLVEILTLHHAQTFIPTTNSTLGYSNAMSTTTSSALAAPIDAASAPDMRRSSPGIKKSWRHLTKKWRHITPPLFPKDSRT